METSDQYWKIYKKWPKRFLLLFLVIFILTLISPVGFDMTNRIRVAEIISLTQQATTEISELLLKNQQINLNVDKLIPKTFNTKSKKGEAIELTYRNISSSGEIQIFSPQVGTLIILKPSISNGKVTWSCWGSPTKNMPASCK